MADRFPEQAESDLTYLVDQKNGDRMIRQLLNSVIAKYRNLSVSLISIGLLQLTITCYKIRHAGGQAHDYSRTGTLKQRDLKQ